MVARSERISICPGSRGMCLVAREWMELSLEPSRSSRREAPLPYRQLVLRPREYVAIPRLELSWCPIDVDCFEGEMVHQGRYYATTNSSMRKCLRQKQKR